MDSVHLDNNSEYIEDESKEQLLSPCAADMVDIFGDPQVLHCVGHKYQAEIPPLISKYDSLQLINEPTDTKISVNLPCCVSLGLPIPLTWVNTEFKDVNGTVEFENSEESQIASTDDHAEPKAEALESTLSNGKDMIRNLNSQSTLESDQMDVDPVFMQEPKTKLDQLEKGLCLLPGSLGGSWKQIEYDSFLLGLYIFEKNLNFVKRFVESKGMGDILSFYYGKFYRSDGYRRWSECRKLKSRRFVYGQKIFTGWRQQELLLRLFSHVSDECKNMLLEDSRKFGEGKISFEEFVFTLKDAVGINMLIEAVGVGKGKKDLTSTAMEPIKNNHMCSLQHEIPVGKACSSLTSADIIRFLTGDFRLSKARSSDLFWEAVWPRLLARGWHSEQPKDHSFSNSKNTLVFLIPGVKRFSRRRLVKGDHYFDSVSDVLNKVASEPGLLELEIEAGKSSEHKEEVRVEQPMKQELDGLSNKQHHCYLQPRKFNHSQHLMQFTIVDTSLFHGVRRSKVRELRSLPVESTNISTPSNLSSESEDNTSEHSEDKEEETNTTNADNITNKEACADSSDCACNVLNNSMSKTPTSTNVAVENHTNHSTSRVDDKQQKEDLMANIHEESSCNFENVSADRKLDESESHCKSNSHDALKDMVSQLGPHHNLSSTSSLAKGNSDRSNEVNISENCLDKEVSSRKLERHILIDLNVSQVSLEFGHNESSKDLILNNDSSSENKLSVIFEPSQQVEESTLVDGKSSIGQQHIINNRRQSARNRPLTTKALEAFAFGFLSPKRKRKDIEASQNIPMSKASRRVHGKTVGGDAVNKGVRDNIADSRIEGSLDALCGNTNIVDESHV